MKHMLLPLPVILAFFCFESWNAVAVGDALASPNPKTPDEVQLLEAGPHHRLWGRIRSYTNALSNQVTSRTNGIYKEVSTGLNYLSNNIWAESSERIQITDNGGQAVQGQHQVVFNSDIYSGTVIHTTSDGKTLSSRILGLSYFDYSSGQSALIAQLTNSIGQVLPSGSQVIYPDAFTGASAAVRFSYTRAGFEQDIILQAQLPDPARYNMNPQTVALQVITEFINPPEPTITLSQTPEGGQSAHLDFGSLQIDKGKAFTIGLEENPVIVYPQWLHSVDQRVFLVEEVSFASLQSQLASLPPPAPGHASISQPTAPGVRAMISRQPKPQPAKANAGPLRLASAGFRETGLVLDYTSITSQSALTFQGDSTYYVSGTVNLTGVTTIEGGAVVKYASNAIVNINGTVNCLAEPYHPSVLLSKDDNSTGSSISGATGNPGTNGYAKVALNLNTGTSNSLQNLRFCNAQSAIGLNGQAGHVFRHIQMVNCQNGINATNADFNLRNALFYKVMTNFTGSSATGRVEHLTSDVANWLNSNLGTNLFLTNCLLVSITNSGSYFSNSVFGALSGSGVFQSIGTAAHYLADNSVYRNAGTTNINATLASDFASFTTYPPLVFELQTVVANTSLSPQAQRDTDIPDAGYHYPALDYAFGNLDVSTGILTLQPGTAVAGYGPMANSSRSLNVDASGTFISQGTATAINHYTLFNTVMEPATNNANWSVPYDTMISPLGLYYCRFTDFSMLAQDSDLISDDSTSATGPVSLQDCQLHGGLVYLGSAALNLTNCLFERVNSAAYNGDGNVNYIRNCLFFGGTLDFATANGGSKIQDNLFYGTHLPSEGPSGTIDHNGYLTGADRLPAGTGDVVLTSFSFQTGSLGKYYVPTNTLFNAGSRTADLAGLYHYTLSTNYLKETNSVVDIGFHYVATTNGIAIDSDGDGLPDYWEDANGNGVLNTGETNWLDPYDWGLSVFIFRPRNNSNLP